MAAHAFTLSSGIFLLAAFLITQVSCREVPRGVGPKLYNETGFVNIDGTQYFVDVDGNVTWLEAISMCEDRDMQILSLQTEQKNNAIISWLRDNTFDWWVWTSGMRFEFVWHWTTTREAFTYQDWADGRPDDGETYPTCLSVSGSLEQNGWEDDYCDGLKLNYICEPVG